MVRIAIVEDERPFAEQLEGYIRRYGQSKGINYKISVFTNGIDLISAPEPSDIVFLDIEMPLMDARDQAHKRMMDGLDAAKKLRDVDKTACIIFVTRLAQCAVRGYEVDAMDYLIKPLEYDAFVPRFEKALRIAASSKSYEIILPLKSGFRRLTVRDIVCVEVSGHQPTFHLKTESFTQRMPLAKAREVLGADFVQCNKCYLVNLAYITEINADTVVVGGHSLELSRLKKRELLDAMAAYFGKKG